MRLAGAATSVLVPVMDIGKVRVRMGHDFMSMRVDMRLAPIPGEIVGMPVMDVVRMHVPMQIGRASCRERV